MFNQSTPELTPVEFEVLTLLPTGEVGDRRTGRAKLWKESLAAGVALEMVILPGGPFTMGAPREEEGWHPSQGPQRSVTLRPFSLSKYPVTQAQWRAVAALPVVGRSLDPDPAHFKGDHHPVEQVSWLEAVEFCDRLTAHTGRPYRLPSEAEWEYACRGGTETPFHVGETLTTDLANYSGVDWEYQGRLCNRGSYGQGPQGEDRRETVPVGYFAHANAFGLCDLHGNVREWCQDTWHDTYAGAPTDGTAWETGGDPKRRILRGGSWNVGPRSCRSAFRSRAEGDRGLYDIGFRVACGWDGFA